MKQIIVIRKGDLPWTAGKMVAQGAHASMGVVLANLEDPRVKEWLSGRFTKVVVRVNNEDDLLKVHEDAKAAGLLTILITDAGLTVFREPTNTAVAVGPDTDEKLQPVTGHLKLL